MAGPTYRERRAARAANLNRWAAAREQQATATLQRDREGLGSDWAFITQPGRIPERARMNARADRAYESLQKAGRMRSRAAGIEAQAARSIYRDDPDAIPALRRKIAGLEAERARIVAYNKAVRKAKRVTPEALALLDDKQRADLLSLARTGMGRADGTFPGYATSNLSGNIARNRERLAQLEREQAAAQAAAPRRSLRGS